MNDATKHGVAASWQKSASIAVLILALLKLLLHLLTSNSYGYYRDELYFLVCGFHLAWGYVDHPPLVPAVVALVSGLCGDSLFAIRLLPALSGAALVILTSVMAGQLGGGRVARVLSALAMLCAPLFWRSHSMLTLAAFEGLLWAACCCLVLRLQNGHDRQRPLRLWLGLGLVLGCGLLNKYSLASYAVSLLLGFLLTPAARRALSTPAGQPGSQPVSDDGTILAAGKAAPALWGAALAVTVTVILMSPNVIWQIRHGWPTLEFLGHLHSQVASRVSLMEFTAGQIFLLNPLTTPLWGAGLWWLLRSQGGERYRPFAWSYVVLYVFFALVKAKIYYLAPAYPILFAAGSVALEKWMARDRQPRRSRHHRRLSHTSVYVTTYVIALVGVGIVMAPLGLRVLPIEKVAGYVKILTAGRRSAQVMAGHYYDMHGWPEIAATVDSLWAELSAEERARCAILAGNYGEASAINVLSHLADLPVAHSGHNSYFLWGPPASDKNLCLIAGIPAVQLEGLFRHVEQVAEIRNRHAAYYETDLPVFLCREPLVSWQEAWLQLRLYR